MKKQLFPLVVFGLAVGLAAPAALAGDNALFNGTANQVLGINSRGTAGEAKSIVGGGTVEESHTQGVITLTGTPRRLSGVSSKGADFTCTFGSVHLVTAAAVATLPSVTGKQAGEEFVIKNTGAGVVTMAGTPTINGAAAGSTTVTAGAQKTFVFDGTNFITL